MNVPPIKHIPTPKDAIIRKYIDDLKKYIDERFDRIEEMLLAMKKKGDKGAE